MAHKLWDLFLTFLKISLITFSGYALLPIAKRELIEKKGWITEEELVDYYAIAQATPGMIATNTSTFCGQKVVGNIGGVVATLAFSLPSVILISLAAIILNQFMDNPYLQSAFAGIRIAVCVLIFNTVISMWRISIRNAFHLIILGATLALTLFLDLSPMLIIIATLVLGIIIQGVKEFSTYRSKNNGEHHNDKTGGE